MSLISFDRVWLLNQHEVIILFIVIVVEVHDASHEGV
jgi:hypothetical protein